MMKRLKRLVMLGAVLGAFSGGRAGEPGVVASVVAGWPEAGRLQVPFNDHWKFQLAADSCFEDAVREERPAKVDYDDSGWREVVLPHDWSIELDFSHDVTGEIGHLKGGVGWYRKRFILPEALRDKRILLDFGGVYMDSAVYVNGRLVGTRPGGYIPFCYDITDEVNCDGATENVVAVRAVNRTEPGDSDRCSSRWYSGSGIYRGVTLAAVEPVQVARYGVTVVTPDLEDEYRRGMPVSVEVGTRIENRQASDRSVTLRTTILKECDGSVFVAPVSSGPFAVEAGAAMEVRQALAAPRPELWSVAADRPALYILRSELLDGDRVVDACNSRFGFRWFKFDPDDGFSLNGKWLKLHGVCLHHDQGALGAVSNYRAVERQLQIMKQMGVNAIRSTHNPASEELHEACDRLGLLMVEEGFDCWGVERGKKAYDYGRFFSRPVPDCRARVPAARAGETWAEYDLAAMVARGKNFPSIIMWSIGNEINNDISTATAGGTETARLLVAVARAADPTRPVTLAEDKLRGDGADRTDNLGGALLETLQQLDVVGLNYSENRYDALHAAYPAMCLYGSETSSAVKSRGFYSDPQKSDNASGIDPYQLSSYDNSAVEWGRTAGESWIYDRDRKFVAGQFVWTGFDYLGEPTPWNQSFESLPKNSYFGIVDTAGFPKDDYYLYQSQWTSAGKNPMVHILPHWNWEDEKLRAKLLVDGKIPVRVYSNAAAVELFFQPAGNAAAGLGESLGRKHFAEIMPYRNERGENVVYQVNGEEPDKLYLEWLLPYRPGRLTAVAFDAAGQEIARDAVATAGEARRIGLTIDRAEIDSDGRDLAYVTVEILDAGGNPVPTADNPVVFSVAGAAKIVGVDNGNAASWERYQADGGIWRRRAFNGKALVILQSTGEAGRFTLTAVSPGLDDAGIAGRAVPLGAPGPLPAVLP